MNPSVIQFACNHCQSELTVPAHLAGVAGPCPRCGQHIVSPYTSTLPATPPAPPTPPPAPAAPQWAPAPEIRETVSMWNAPPLAAQAPIPVAPPMPQSPVMGSSPWPEIKVPLQLPTMAPPASPTGPLHSAAPAMPSWGAPQQPEQSYNQPPQMPGGFGGMPPARPPSQPLMPSMRPPSGPLMPPQGYHQDPAMDRPPVVPMMPGGFGSMPPARPPTQPLMRPPTGPLAPLRPSTAPILPQRPPTGPLIPPHPEMQQGLYPQQSHTVPSVAMQPSLLRPSQDNGYVNQGPAAAPPQQMPSAAEAAMMQMQQPAPQTDPGFGATSALSRPMTIGGSRLSLLARQLTASPDGGAGLPAAPPPLSNQDIPGADAPLPVQMPDGLRNQAAANLLIQQQLSRAQGISMTPRSSGGLKKFMMAALLLLCAAGATLWIMRDQLGLVPKNLDPGPVEPTITRESKRGPEPGVDPIPRTKKEREEEPRVATVRAPDPIEPKITPSPAPPPEPEPVVKPPTPPKAQPVEEETPVPRAVPVEEGTLKPMVAQTPSPDQGGLVEVGRTKDDPKVIPGSASSTLAESVEKPIVKNVPPKCQKALDGLKKFLGAHTLKERLPYMQMASQIERKAAIYYTSNPDGPVDVDEIHYLRHDEDPQVGKGMHVVFVIFSRAWEYGIPVMVEQTGDNTRIDWLSFVEFKDDLLHKFLTTYMDGPVRFHVGIRRTHYFEDDIPNVEEKDTFEVTTPMENVHGFVFVPRGSPLQRSLSSTISWDKEMSWVIVELQWRRQGSSKWVEMTALPQLNWYSAGGDDAPESTSAPSSALTK